MVAETLSVDAVFPIAGASVEIGFEATAGAITVLLGPNGAGKTSTLRAVAGLSEIDDGRISLGERVLAEPGRGIHVPADERRTGFVFQDLVLFPHLSVRDNVAFGAGRAGSGDPQTEASRWLERLNLTELADARPATLSGGEAQRVAVARALASDPLLLLLDEPFGSLDASARREVRGMIRDHLAAFPGPAVVVTHDPLEAMAMADRVTVIEAGRVVQEGTPADLRSRPRTPYVADLVGINLFRGSATEGRVRLAAGELVAPGATSGEVLATIHPRSVSLHLQRPAGTPRNVWSGRVRAIDDEGDRMRVEVDGPPDMVAEITPSARAELGLEPGTEVWMAVKATEIGVYPA